MALTGQTLPPGQNMVNTSPPPIVRFLKAEPKALGTVQIMIGLITLLFGIVLASDFSVALASVLTGNLYWASIVYIIAGSLSVAAETKLHPCVVQGSLGMNVVSAVFSAVGIGVLITDFFLYHNCYTSECYSFQARTKAISGVLLVFAVLQFIISISISVFACKATCCSETMVPFVTYGNQTVTGNPQVPVATFANQAVRGNAQNLVYIPQAQVNMNNPVQQNHPVQQNIHDWPGR
ncbi:membrane-spanning 4-domains subfamily A member 4A [Ictalurus punctatus]|uniref:Membrane-spanning 4-domains subfamily A member 4A n=1 Tax=Ictalurus punctatus TaxID=7998 RepID=A0A2D0S1E5_ICTPU|nr:membrane-spanning 4-domains subfamily A member 4A [Ictalurus punctatus]